jgi:hypothetical protein
MALIKPISMSVGTGALETVWVVDDQGRVWRMVYDTTAHTLVQPWTQITTLPVAP